MPIPRPSFTSLVALICLTAFPMSEAWADFNYKFHWGRIPVAEFNLALPTEDSQTIKVEGETVGLIGRIFRYDGAIESDYSDMNSVLFSVSGEDNGFSEYRTIQFYPDKSAHIVNFLDDEQDQPPKELVESMGITVDPLRVVLSLLKSTDAEECQGEFSVFDGKRHYLLNLTTAGAEELEADRSWAYSGPTIRCELTVNYLESTTGEEQNPWYREDSEQRSIWLAELEGQLVPVRVSMPGPIGKVTGRLISE
jgi:hypothetical protein